MIVLLGGILLLVGAIQGMVAFGRVKDLDERLSALKQELSRLRADLERQRKAGAVAVKFEAAYLRALDFGPASASEARRVYAKYAAGGVPSRPEYKTLEDHLFRVIAREAGRLGMAVHIHATDGGGGFYSARGSDPTLLESAFNDSTLRATNFVIIHGGWPLTRQTTSMMHKPNVYADISMMTFIAPS
ncbi:MAG: amidohydrolase family protein, partial [Planctomycetes bacterium]|nr:amidohydrolase family protein [Planctomycetota bacterium]